MRTGCNNWEAWRYLFGERKPMEHSSPGGHFSSKWHPSKLFHTSHYGGFAGRFTLSSPTSWTAEINRKSPTDARRVIREKYALWGRPKGAVLAWAQLGTGHSSPQLEERDLSPEQGVDPRVSAQELGAYAGRACGAIALPRQRCLPPPELTWPLWPDLQQLPWEPWHPGHPRLLRTHLPQPGHPRWQNTAFRFASPLCELLASSHRKRCCSR